MASYITLKENPIKEIILTISFRENVELDILDNFKSSSLISKEFPNSDKGFRTKLSPPKHTEKLPPSADILHDGFVLSNEKKTKSLHARIGSFSFHKIKEYESFQNLSSEFNIYWNELVKLNGNLNVSNLNVRYLNFFELGEDEIINDLLTIKTTHPFGERLVNRFTNIKFDYDKNPKINATIVITGGTIEKKTGLVLDIMLNKKIEMEEMDVFDFDEFSEMRDAKNDIFFQCITETTINKLNR